MTEIFETMQDVQKQILPKVFVAPKSSVQERAVSEFLSKILEYDSTICQLALGDFGTRLYDVVSDIDLEHPEVLAGNFLHSLNNDPEVCDKVIDLLKLCLLAKQNGLDGIYSALSKCAVKHIVPDVKCNIDLLKNCHQFVRLYKTTEDRERLRSIKTARPIELTSCFKKMTGVWDSITDLNSYARFGNYCQEQVDRISKRADIYKQLKLQSMCADLQASIAEYQATCDESYLGFQRVPMTHLAVILAKMHGCAVDPISNSKIVIPTKLFEGYEFENERQLIYTETKDGSWGGVPDRSRRPHFDYLPMAYPTKALELPSDEIGKVLDHLESMPDMNGKPAFDHYVVIVPGVNFPINGHNYIIDLDGNKKHFSDVFTGRMELDKMLIKGKYVVPALAGEKDGKCYFICLWM